MPHRLRGLAAFALVATATSFSAPTKRTGISFLPEETVARAVSLGV